MKIIFNRKEAADVVSPLMATVGGNSTNPAVDGILIEAKKPSLVTLTTYDLEKGMRTDMEADVEEEGCFVINAQKFFKTLQVMEDENVTLTVDNKLCATIKSGKSTFSIKALDGDDFPDVPALKSEMGFYISEGFLRKMFAKTYYAMAQQDQRVVLNGCYIHVEDDNFMIVSCDGFKLAKCVKKSDIKKGNEEDRFIRYSFILPVKTVAELMKLLSDGEKEKNEKMTRIYLMRKNIVFEIGDIVFFSRLIEGEYIDYDRIIRPEQKIKVEVSKEKIMRALERAALITEEKIAGSVRSHVKLNIEGENIQISAVSTNGSSYEEIPVVHEGEDILIAFNNRYLMDSIRACDTEKVLLSLSTPLTSMNVEPVGDETDMSELYMLLPVRMKE